MNITFDVAQTIQAIGALLTALGTLATVLIGLHNSRLGRKNEQGIASAAAKVDAVGETTMATHLSTNSKMDQLLQVSAAAAKAEGNLEGRAEQTAENAAITKGT